MDFVKKFRRAALTVATLAAMALFLAFPARYAKAVSEGISLWAVSVLPATLPFLVLTAVFTKLGLFGRVSARIAPAAGRLFGVSGAGGSAAILSALSGYPIGARTVLDLSEAKLIAPEEAQRVAAVATTSGPAFLVGAVGGGMFHSAAAGWILFASHLAGIYLVALFLRLFRKPQPAKSPLLPSAPLSLSDILLNSVLSVLSVGAAIAVFYAFGAMLSDMGAFLDLSPSAEGVLRGLFEMTSGCMLLSRSPSALSLALCCFLVTFGGLCVLVQQLAFLSKANVRALPFAAVKLAQGAVSAGVCYLLALALF